jgi:LmbE family N-acetylglucosaminyl deacetylase
MLTLEGRLLVISPHLDDAVFACGRLIASHPSCVVVTVFAGRPASTNPLTEWDRACGFEPGDDVIGARREEDRAALYLLAAAPIWLDFLDSQYGRTPSVAQLVCELETIINYVKPSSVLFPIGLFHSDHLLTHRAARVLAARYAEVQWVAYEDALYRRIPDALEGRLAELEGERLRARKVAWPDAPRAEQRKRAAVNCYRSQLRALATPGRLGHRDAYEGEGYWSLEAAEQREEETSDGAGALQSRVQK